MTALRYSATLLSMLVVSATALAQAPPVTVTAPSRKLPESVASKLTPSDRVLFDKLMRVGLERRGRQLQAKAIRSVSSTS